MRRLINGTNSSTMSFHNKTISLNYRVVSHPLGYGDISATRVTKSETCFRNLGNAKVSRSYMHTWKPLQHRSQMFKEWALTWSPLEADYVTIRNYI
jgi:hypothetical protein